MQTAFHVCWAGQHPFQYRLGPSKNPGLPYLEQVRTSGWLLRSPTTRLPRRPRRPGALQTSPHPPPHALRRPSSAVACAFL